MTRVMRLTVLFMLLLAMKGNAAMDECRALWDLSQLPAFQDGVRVEGESSWDRTGGNDDGFSGTYSFLRKEGDKLVIIDQQGPGVITRIWTPTPTDDPLEFYFDGESSPRLTLKFSDLFSGKVEPFVAPLCGQEVGGYTCYLPIPYAKSIKILFCGEKIRFHQFQFKGYPAGTPVESFEPGSDTVKEKINQINEVWSKQGRSVTQWSAPAGAAVRTERLTVRVAPGQRVPIIDLEEPGRIVGLRLGPAAAFSGDRKRLMLRVTWDDETSSPAIHCPVADFFGFAYGKASARGLLLGTAEGTGYCYLPMPFERRALLELENLPTEGETIDSIPALVIDAEVDWVPGAGPSAQEGKLYTQWRRTRPAEGVDYLIAEVAGRGHTVGTLLQAQGLNPGITSFFEGDDILTLDGEMRIHGTGSEDFFNGGWYALPDRWDGPASLPLHGCLDYSIPLARTGGYRFHLADKVSFERSLRLTIEHGPEGNKVPVDYTSLAFFYLDRAPEALAAPTPAQRVIWQPEVLDYWPMLLPIEALWIESRVSYHSWKTHNDPLAGFENDMMELAPARDGSEAMMKLGLDVPATGTYEIALSYLSGPECGRIRVAQRQATLVEALDTYAPEQRLVERRVIGMARFVAGRQSLSIHLAGRSAEATGGVFRLHRLHLKRLSAEQ